MLICGAKQALSEGNSGPVKTRLTGPGAMALNVFVIAGRFYLFHKKALG